MFVHFYSRARSLLNRLLRRALRRFIARSFYTLSLWEDPHSALPCSAVSLLLIKHLCFELDPAPVSLKSETLTVNRCRYRKCGKMPTEVENIFSKKRKWCSLTPTILTEAKLLIVFYCTKFMKSMGDGKCILWSLMWVTLCFWADVEATSGYFWFRTDVLTQYTISPLHSLFTQCPHDALKCLVA